MALKTVYYLADCDCGKTDLRTWFTADSAANHAECPACHNLRAVLEKREKYRAYVPYTARKRFTPHWNRSLGCEVESPEHLKHLQEVHGTMDFEPGRVHSDGSCDYTSRDLDTGKAELRERIGKLAEETFGGEEPELDYNPDGSWTVTELGEDE